MADLDRIQLDIVVNLQGLDSVNRLNRALGSMTTAQGKAAGVGGELEATNWRQVKSWGGLTAWLSKAERELDAVWRAGVHLKALGSDLIGISKDILGTGIAVVDMYRDYDYWLRRASVALNTNTEWQAKLDKSIQDTAISVGLLKPEEVAEAFNVWGAATGVTVDNMDTLRFVTDAVKDVIIATAGAGGSLEGNLKGVAAILGQFNMDMSEAGHVTRVLALMTERTQADFGDLSSAFSYIGPLAHSLGIEFDDVAQILGVLADSGQRGSRAGRGLSMVIEGLSAPSEKAAKALDMVVNGFKKGKREWADVAFPKGDFIGMEATVRELAKGLFNATDAQRGYVYSTAFSNNATRALIPLIERTIELWREDADAMREGKTALDETKYSLDNAGAFFENMTTQMTESINAVIGSFQNSFFPIIQLVAVRIMELAKPVLGALKVALGQLADWLRENQWAVDLAVQVGAVVAIVTGLAGVFFSVVGTFILLGAGIAFFIKGLSGIVFAFTVLGAVIGGVAAAIANNVGGIRDAFVNLFGEVAAILKPASDAFNQFALTISDLPSMIGPHVEGFFGALADAINFLADALRTIRNDPVLSQLATMFAIFAGTLAAFVVTARTAGAILGTIAGGLWAVTRAASGLNLLIGGLVALPGPLKLVAVIAGIASALWYAWENNVLGFRDAVMSVISWVQANLPGAIATVQGIFNTLLTKGQELLSVAVPAIQSFVSSAVTFFQQLWSVVGPILAAIWAPFDRLITYGIPALIDLIGRLVEAWVPVFQQIAETVVGVFVNNILPTIQTFLDMVNEHLVPLLLELAEWFRVAWDVIVTVVGAAIGFIVKVITEFLIAIAPIVQGGLDAVIRIFGIAFEFIFKTVSNVLGTIFDVIRGVMEAIRGFIGVIMGLIKGDWNAVWNGIKGIVSGIFTAIKGLVEGALRNLGQIVDTGLKVVSGIFEFIFGMEPGSIYSKIVGFLQTALKFGGDILKSMADGVSKAISWAISTIGGFIHNILKSIGGAISGSGGGGGIFNTLISMGKNIVFGLWEGIQKMFHWMIDKITGFIRDVIPGPIKDFLGIHSPSQMMAELGAYIVDGLAMGITANDAAVDAMTAQALSLEKAAAAGADRISMALETQVAGSTATGVSITTANKKVIRLEVEVTSPDGSVDSLTTEQLADLIKGPDLVSALEHMAANV
jgi:TP901 family phage tail tape measure protein